MSAMYFWDGHRAITEQASILTNSCEPYLGMPCVDDKEATNKDGGRYGKFTESAIAGMYLWDTLTIDTLPKEFRANLLLLGVS